MTKRFQTVYSNGHIDATSNCHEAINYRNFDDGQRFFLSGEEVSAELFYSSANADVSAKWEAKNTTHKRVRVLHGNSVACYVEKWVKR